MASPRDNGEIPDAPKILKYPELPGITVVGDIEQRNQRCSVASDSHVPGAEIGDDWDSETSCQNCSFASLPRRRDQSSKKSRGRTLVIESLAMAANHLDFNFLIVHSFRYSLGIQLAQQEIHPCKISNARRTRIHSSEHRSPYHIGISEMLMRKQP